MKILTGVSRGNVIVKSLSSKGRATTSKNRGEQ